METQKIKIFAKVCTATREYSELEESVIVWNKTVVIHLCPIWNNCRIPHGKKLKQYNGHIKWESCIQNYGRKNCLPCKNDNDNI